MTIKDFLKHFFGGYTICRLPIAFNAEGFPNKDSSFYYLRQQNPPYMVNINDLIFNDEGVIIEQIRPKVCKKCKSPLIYQHWGKFITDRSTDDPGHWEWTTYTCPNGHGFLVL